MNLRTKLPLPGSKWFFIIILSVATLTVISSSLDLKFLKDDASSFDDAKTLLAASFS